MAFPTTPEGQLQMMEELEKYLARFMAEQVRTAAIEAAVQAFNFPEQELVYSNHYHCDDCDVSWDDEWSCAVDDECPQCGKDISPHCFEVEGEDDAA